MGTDSDETALLRRYEPVLAYTAGELFFPTDAGDYVRCCGLWRNETELRPAGELTIDDLVDAAEEDPAGDLSLLLVQRPFDRAEVRRYRRAGRRPSIAKSGRLAAVGLIGRVFDVLLRASLFLRGSVPGGVAAAAADRYEREMRPERRTYYGRVVREGGYTVLQYWYLYAMNDWRTTFGGVNDHEADWEAITVYLDADLEPAWLAVSAHDNHGDDLRRRWDDPELAKEGDHPVVFVGAGSHSGAVVRGQYVVTVDPVRVRSYVRGVQRVSRAIFPWTREGRRYGVGIPFVDYALGDGERVRDWHAVRISDDTPWVHAFRGLWGRDTRDWLGGERAPAGPRYERDGRVRTLWSDPLGWAGLQKVPPSADEARSDLLDRIAALGEELKAADVQIAADRAGLRRLRSTAVSLDQHANTRSLARRRNTEVAEAETALTEKIRRRTELAEERAAHEATLARPPKPSGAQEHLREPHLPYAAKGSRTRILNAWAALSTPLFLLALVAIFAVPREPHAILFGAIILLFITLEAWARRKLLAWVTGVLLLVGALAIVVGLGVAAVYGGRYVILAPIVAIALVLLFVNLRDLFHR